MPPRARAGQVKGNADDVLWRWLYSASCDVVAPGGRAREAAGYATQLHALQLGFRLLQKPVQQPSATDSRPHHVLTQMRVRNGRRVEEHISDSALPFGGGRKGVT